MFGFLLIPSSGLSTLGTGENKPSGRRTRSGDPTRCSVRALGRLNPPTNPGAKPGVPGEGREGKRALPARDGPSGRRGDVLVATILPLQTLWHGSLRIGSYRPLAELRMQGVGTHCPGTGAKCGTADFYYYSACKRSLIETTLRRAETVASCLPGKIRTHSAARRRIWLTRLAELQAEICRLPLSPISPPCQVLFQMDVILMGG
ncbi:hypothetical protein Bbelb_123600 [Branchiostoma belcheri]|nr:hypothetical protein Bbelb_123600 [Branchiostoma belcheri]